ncbi:DMT family transporter [Catenulispora subtropica]|uniref:DMT family transporter n=2 Tax=Catenulispora subtropica TaxID=450798 RepID=A0ABN2TC97_9ACTN
MAVLGVAVTAVGTSGPLIAAADAPAMAIAFWRNAIATAVFAPYVLARRGLRAELRGLGARTTLLALVSGLVLGAHFATWTPSAKLSSVASATAFAATQPIFAAVVARAMGHHVPRRAWSGIVVAFAGVIVLSGVDFHASLRAFEGDLLALTAAAFAAVYMTIGGEVRKTASLPTYALLCYGAASVFLIGAAVATGSSLTGFGGGAWAKIGALTVLAQFLGHTLFNRVVKTTSPTVISTAILLEVPLAAVIAAIFLGQVPSVWAIPGAVLILGGLLLVVTGNRT